MAQNERITVNFFQAQELRSWYMDNYSIGDGDDCGIFLSPFVITLPDSYGAGTYVIFTEDGAKTGSILFFNGGAVKSPGEAIFSTKFKTDDRDDGMSGIDFEYPVEHSCNDKLYREVDAGNVSLDECSELAGNVYILYRATMKLLEVSNGQAYMSRTVPKWLLKQEKQKRKKSGKSSRSESIMDPPPLIFYGDRNQCAILPSTVSVKDVLGYNIPIILRKEESEQLQEAVADRFIVPSQNVLKELVKRLPGPKNLKKGQKRIFLRKTMSLSAMEIIFAYNDDNPFLAIKIIVQHSSDGAVVMYVSQKIYSMEELEQSGPQYIDIPIIGTHQSNGTMKWRVSENHPWKRDKKAKDLPWMLDDFYAIFCGINRLLEDINNQKKVVILDAKSSNNAEESSVKEKDVDEYEERIRDAVNNEPRIRTILLNNKNELFISNSTSGRGGYQHTHEYTRRGCWVHMKNGKVYWRRESVCCKGRGPRVQKTTIIKES